MGCPCGSLDGNYLCGLSPGGRGAYNAEGITKITEMLKTNTTLTSIRYAARPSLLGMLAAPSLICSHICVRGSLAHNYLTDRGDDMSGVIKLAEALKENHSLVELKCAPSQCLRSPALPRKR